VALDFPSPFPLPSEMRVTPELVQFGAVSFDDIHIPETSDKIQGHPKFKKG
jgi:hypothetical protein